MQLRYVVVQVVPHLIRDERRNVGIILQSDTRVDCKFLDAIPQDWDISADVADIVHNLQSTWQKRLSKTSETLYLPDSGIQREVSHIDERFLEWLHQTYNRQIRFSDVRGVSIQVNDASDFDRTLLWLYDTFVAPKAKKPCSSSVLYK